MAIAQPEKRGIDPCGRGKGIQKKLDDGVYNGQAKNAYV